MSTHAAKLEPGVHAWPEGALVRVTQNGCYMHSSRAPRAGTMGVVLDGGVTFMTTRGVSHLPCHSCGELVQDWTAAS